MFDIKIANILVRIDNQYSYVRHLCRDYLVESEVDPELFVRVDAKEIEDEMVAAVHQVTPDYAEAVCAYRKICRQLPERFGAFLMHSAVIEYQGEGYAFAAHSGTGKSTHISLWRQHFGEDVHIVNGDKPILRFIDNRLYAFGTPWCGKEGWHTNAGVPLKAICFLERAEVNTIRPIEPKEAIGRIFHQLLSPEDLKTVDALFPLLDRMLREIPCYLLGCNISEEAAEVAYLGMKNETTKGFSK